MRPHKYLKLAFNILRHSKLRSWLTIIGIVIGVASIVAIVSIGEGAQASVNSRLSGLGADIITISPGAERAIGGFRLSAGGGGGGFGGEASVTQKNLTNHDVQTIKSVQDISFINPIVSGRASITYLAQSATVSVQGVDPLAWSNIITTGLASGRYLTTSDTNSIVIGNRLATSEFKQQLLVNTNVLIQGRMFKIVGILQSTGGGGGGGDNTVYMPLSEAVTTIPSASQNNFNSITVKAASVDAVGSVVSNIDTAFMNARHVTNSTKDYSVTSAQQIQASIQSVTQTFTLFLGAIAAVSLLVGAVGIANTMFTSVLEKTKEIGVMKAIGARNFDIMTIFLLNSGLVGLVGGGIGVALGITISTLLPRTLTRLIPGTSGSVQTALPTSFIIVALIVSVGIGMIAGAIPAWRASKLKPVDALRYE